MIIEIKEYKDSFDKFFDGYEYICASERMKPKVR